MELAEEKEQEARQLRERYVEQLQQQSARAREAVCEEQLLRQQLQADFEYNLQLLGERDRELGQYEVAVAEMRAAINSLTAENSELKVALAESGCTMAKEREDREGDRERHRQRFNQLHAEMEAFRSAKSEEVDGERRRCEGVRRELERRLREVEEEGQRVRSEVTAHFEEEARRMQRQYSTQAEQLESAVLLGQAQGKQLSRDLEAAKSRLQETQEEAQSLRERVAELERQLRAQEWAWQDRLVAMETELNEVRGQMEHALTTLTSSQEDFQHRYAELDRQVREKTLCLQTAKEAWAEHKAELECRVREVEAECVKGQEERREEMVGMAEQLREKDVRIQSLQCELEQRAREAERQQTDTQSQLLHDREQLDRLQTALQNATSDLQNARQTVSEAAERERLQEAESRERVREAERTASCRAHAALRTLAQDRDQAAAELRGAKEELSRLQKALDGVAKERDVAIATLNTHNLYQHFLADLEEVKGQPAESHDMSHDMLSRQNAQLKSVIALMRKEVEQLSVTGDSGSSANQNGELSSVGVVCSQGYIKYLESELVAVKTENRRLRAEGRGVRKPPLSPQTTVGGSRHHSPPSPRHRSHLVALGEAMAVLQKEKTSVELRGVWLQQQLASCQASLRARAEEVYQLRALRVRPDQCQEKLLQATRAILSLVRERDSLLAALQDRGASQAVLQDRGTSQAALQDRGTSQAVLQDRGTSQAVLQDRGASQGDVQDRGTSQGDVQDRGTSQGDVQDKGYVGVREESQQAETGGQPAESCAQESPLEHREPLGQAEDATTSLAEQRESWQPEPSLSSLQFSDSEVEGQRSLERMLSLADDNVLSSSPGHQAHSHPSQHSPGHQAHPHPSQHSPGHQAHPHPSQHSPGHQAHPHPSQHSPGHRAHPQPSAYESAKEDVVAMEMHGRGLVRHTRLRPGKPHGAVLRRPAAAAAASRGLRVRNYSMKTD